MSPDDKLTPLAHRLLDILLANGDWMRRRDLARGLGAGRLEPYTKRVLNNLADLELIEVRTVISERNRQCYEYRVKSEAPNGV